MGIFLILLAGLFVVIAVFSFNVWLGLALLCAFGAMAWNFLSELSKPTTTPHDRKT